MENHEGMEINKATKSNEELESYEAVSGNQEIAGSEEMNSNKDLIDSFETIDNHGKTDSHKAIESLEKMDGYEESDRNEPQCSICGNGASLLQVKNKWICEPCLRIGMGELTSPWTESLGGLFKEYLDDCERCLTAEQPEDVHRIRVTGRKIRAFLEFIGVPKNHELLLAIRKVHRILDKVRKNDVLLEEMKKNSEENIVYAEMVKAVAKTQKKQYKQIGKKIPAIINKAFARKAENFMNNELVPYVLPLEKEKVLLQYEESFIQFTAAYHQSVEENGKTAPATIKALHAVRKKSKSLRYIYNFLNETFDGHYQDMESYYKDLQQQFGDINDTKDWMLQIKAYGKKLNASKHDMNDCIEALKVRLQNLIENVNLFKRPLKH